MCWVTGVNKADRNPCPNGAYFLVGGTNSDQDKGVKCKLYQIVVDGTEIKQRWEAGRAGEGMLLMQGAMGTGG